VPSLFPGPETVNHLTLIPLALALHLSGATIARAGGDSSAVLSLRVEPPAEPVQAGEECRVLLFLIIRDGWHINAPVPSDSDLVGTSLQIQRSGEIDSVVIRFPDPVARQLDFSEIPLEVYEGTVVVPVHLHLATGLRSGTYAIRATLTYQACNALVCLAPVAVETTIPIHVRSRHRAPRRVNRTNTLPPEKGRHP
jgi:DsbC/DsbD-like thiol-disulfide interchange protein